MLLLREPPANGQFMVAAYVVALVILLGYSVLLLRRAGKALKSSSLHALTSVMPP